MTPPMPADPPPPPESPLPSGSGGFGPPELLLTAGGLGLMRPASGTWGSTPPPAMVLILLLAGASTAAINTLLLLLAIAASWVCLRFGRRAEARWGAKDPGQVVADEVAGQSVALLLLPWRPIEGVPDLLHDVMLAGGAFLAFRVMDIIKPPPARGLQRLPAGAGILVDDLIAGVYAWLLVRAGLLVLGG